MGAMPARNSGAVDTYPKCRGTRLKEETASNDASVIAVPEPDLGYAYLNKWSCPDCGTEMALRKFQSGPRVDEEFWECVSCKKLVR